MEVWQIIFDIVLIFGAAFFLGALAERFSLNAIVGYLLAGAILGPLLFHGEAISHFAEVGVALLLFTIGLEFSLTKLRSLGMMTFVGGSFQVLLTMALFTAFFINFYPTKEAIALAGMVALSSTAVVLRVLMQKAQLDSIHGRNAISILLLQDIAVVPLVLLVTILGEGGTATQTAYTVGKTIAAALILVAIFYIAFYKLFPFLLLTKTVIRNSDLVVLLAVAGAISASWGAHKLGLSPALGAFLAGVLLGESPFATQIRADVGPLRTIFATLFFTAIGMLAQPLWILKNLHFVILGTIIIMVGKTIVVYIVARAFRQNRFDSLATGISLGQVGEFSFVLATAGLANGLIDKEPFTQIVSITIFSLFCAPFMVGWAEPISSKIINRFYPKYKPEKRKIKESGPECNIFIIGFGPAGKQVANRLIEMQLHPIVIEQNPFTAQEAERLGLEAHVGNARQSEVLAHAGIKSGCYVIVTVPDPKTSLMIVDHIREWAPRAYLIVRSRFHLHFWELEEAGSDIVVDEEYEVGRKLAEKAAEAISCDVNGGQACMESPEPKEK